MVYLLFLVFWCFSSSAMKVRFLCVGVTGSSVSAHINTHTRTHAHTHTHAHAHTHTHTHTHTLRDLMLLFVLTINLTHFFNVFISLLYMFRATQCSSSGESIVSLHHLVYITPCRWPSGMQVCDLHTRRSPTRSDIYQMM